MANIQYIGHVPFPCEQGLTPSMRGPKSSHKGPPKRHMRVPLPLSLVLQSGDPPPLSSLWKKASLSLTFGIKCTHTLSLASSRISQKLIIPPPSTHTWSPPMPFLAKYLSKMKLVSPMAEKDWSTSWMEGQKHHDTPMHPLTSEPTPLHLVISHLAFPLHGQKSSILLQLFPLFLVLAQDLLPFNNSTTPPHQTLQKIKNQIILSLLAHLSIFTPLSFTHTHTQL